MLGTLANVLGRGVAISPEVGSDGRRLGTIRYGALLIDWEAVPACHGKNFEVRFPGKPCGLSAERETTLKSWILAALTGH